MSVPDRKTLMNEAYDALLYTTGAIVISMASKKIIKEPLGVPENVNGVLKLGAAVAGGTILIKYLQSKKFIPDDPFK